VTIIARLVMDIMAVHSLETYDYVLQCLVPSRSYMGWIGYERWTVYKVEPRFLQRLFLRLLVCPTSLPPSKYFFLGFRGFVIASEFAYDSLAQLLYCSEEGFVESKISGLTGAG